MAKFMDVSALMSHHNSQDDDDSDADVRWNIPHVDLTQERDDDEDEPEPEPLPEVKLPEKKQQVLQTAQFFLTFPKNDTDMEDCKTFLFDWAAICGVNIVDWLIASEDHKDGTPHLHVYFKLDKKIKMKGTESLDIIGGGKHGNYQGCRSPNAVIKYCVKGDNYISNIDVPAKLKALGGKHKYICTSILTGRKSVAEVIDENPEMLLQANNINRGIAIYNSAKAKPRTCAPKVLVHWGPSGTGKSFAASKLCLPDRTYFKPAGHWWPAYAPAIGDEGHHLVVIDEFDKDPMSYEEFLTLCDRYPKQVPYKGGFSLFNSPTIVFTSTQHPRDWWPDKDFSQVSRRISRCVHFTRRHVDAHDMVEEEYDHDQARL